jgi:hypothetical protein
LATVLSFYLQRQGLLVLHASTVVIDDRAVAFLSHKFSGKSTIAAALVKSGHPLLTDDILTIEERDGILIGRPGYPQMRLWPEEANNFVGHYKDLERVLPDLSKRCVPVGLGALVPFPTVHNPWLAFMCRNADLLKRGQRS